MNLKKVKKDETKTLSCAWQNVFHLVSFSVVCVLLLFIKILTKKSKQNG
jgi:hypothetical protein